jgi:hypothetical protein
MNNKISKVAVTLELNDDQMVAIGMAETGYMVKAKHAEVRSYITEVTMRAINNLAGIVKEQREETAQLIKDSLNAERQSNE